MYNNNICLQSYIYVVFPDRFFQLIVQVWLCDKYYCKQTETIKKTVSYHVYQVAFRVARILIPKVLLYNTDLEN